MNLVKEIRTSMLVIEIYSLNPNLIVNDDPSLFEGKEDIAIRDIVFNQMGAEEVRLYDLAIDGAAQNLRTYSLV